MINEYGYNNLKWLLLILYCITTMVITTELCNSATEISSGPYHTCAIFNGTVKCWGENKHGQCGRDTQEYITDMSLSTAVNLGNDFYAVKLATGAEHSCAVSSTHKVKCWGSNQFGQLGYDMINGVAINRGGPQPSILINNGSLDDVDLGLHLAIDITAGWYHTCALSTVGAIKCWGANNFGQLGQDNTDMDTGNSQGGTPKFVLPGYQHTKIMAGGHHTCAVSGGKVRCWGLNDKYQLGMENPGLGNGLSHSSPIGSGGHFKMTDLAQGANIPTDFNVIDVITGGYGTCVLSDRPQYNGIIICWGLIVGSPQQEPLSELAKIDVGFKIKQVSIGQPLDASGGQTHACALEDNINGGQIKCWGYNDKGQLDSALATSVPSYTFGGVPTIAVGFNVSKMAVKFGDSHTCVIISSSQVKCWGDNTKKQLGVVDQNGLIDFTCSDPSPPTSQPTNPPIAQPTNSPTTQPTVAPTTITTETTSAPIAQTTVQPTTQPTDSPTFQPTVTPTTVTTQTSEPIAQSTVLPTQQPTIPPTVAVTNTPTTPPTSQPINEATVPPTTVTTGTTLAPVTQQTNSPTSQPTNQPTTPPTTVTTGITSAPTAQPTTQPTASLTEQPTSPPTNSQTTSAQPTQITTLAPSLQINPSKVTIIPAKLKINIIGNNTNNECLDCVLQIIRNKPSRIVDL